jgi:uncharacterized protein YggE
MKTARLALALAAALAAAPLAASRAGAADETGITVTGSARVSAAPDQALVSIGVVAEAATAKEALAENNEATAAVIAAIKAAGVEARDVQTSDLSVFPRYDEAESGRAPTLVGYSVRNAVSVRVRAIGSLGGLLDAVVKAGANEIQGISFLVGDADRRRDEARTAAFGDARRKAELYAEAAGLALGSVRSLSEHAAPGGPPRPMLRMAADAAPAVPVESGEVELAVDITVTFATSPKP